MLLEFSVKNFGPFRDTATLSMQGTTGTELPENVFSDETVKGGILASAAVFGANSSGKSYLVRAVSALKAMVSDAYEEGFEYAWYQPFRLSRVSLSSPTELSISIVSEDGIYDYSVSYVRNSITFESLLHYPPGGRKRMIFERDSLKKTCKGCKADILERTSPSSTYLTVGSKYNDPICNAVRRFILEGILIVSDDCDRHIGPTFEKSRDDPEIKKLMLDALQAADLGISDFHGDVIEWEPSAMERALPPPVYKMYMESGRKVKSANVYLVHDFEDSDVDREQASFPMDIESRGTQTIFGMMGFLLDALMEGKVVFIDEFGSHMHPMLTRWVVEQFRVDVNPNKAQLIVNTHDLSLMDIQGLLRRDQVFFTDKNRWDGSASLYSLADFKGVRKDADVLKSYLIGRFDAIPDVSVWRRG